jgi:hypothetical protein
LAVLQNRIEQCQNKWLGVVDPGSFPWHTSLRLILTRFRKLS